MHAGGYMAEVLGSAPLDYPAEGYEGRLALSVPAAQGHRASASQVT